MTQVAVFTATRAEYGLLRPILREILRVDGLSLSLIVTGAHLSQVHGRTVQAILDDGVPIAEQIPTLIDDDSAVGTSTSMALTLQAVAGALERQRPDVLLLLGDRYEALAAASAAMIANVPIAHVHGGETTVGAFDEGVRHAITKMAHVHLVAAPEFRDRIIQLGENPERIHVVGAPGLDMLRIVPEISRDAVADEIGWDVGPSYVLVTYHPVTLDPENSHVEVKGLIEAMSELERRGTKTLITGPNADPASDEIRQRLIHHARNHPDSSLFVASLGTSLYVNAMRHAVALVGNSSSGIIEAPFLGTPTVNIGRRQHGRPRADLVSDVGANPNEIVTAVDRASQQARAVSSTYGDGQAARRIVEQLLAAPLHDLLLKEFRDLEPHG